MCVSRPTRISQVAATRSNARHPPKLPQAAKTSSLMLHLSSLGAVKLDRAVSWLCCAPGSGAVAGLGSLW
jgi:hypothetical protein